MKDRQFHIYLDDEEYGQVLQALIALKNNLIAQGRYTDAVDDVLIKFTRKRLIRTPTGKARGGAETTRPIIRFPVVSCLPLMK